MSMHELFDSSNEFYYVDRETIDGIKRTVIYPLGYFYCAGNSVTDNPDQIYRFEEHAQMPITLERLKACGYNVEQDEDFQCRCGDAMYDLTYEEACAKLVDLMEEMGSRSHCVPLPLVNDTMKAGLYYDGVGLIW